MHAIQDGWSLERIIQPLVQVAVNKQLLAQQGDQVRQRPVKFGFELQKLQDQNRDQRRPELCLQRIGAGPDEGLHASQLLQAFEEDFDLPPILVDFGDRGGPSSR